jgi:cobalt-zinc-cadmium efflux system outer membrane protein
MTTETQGERETRRRPIKLRRRFSFPPIFRPLAFCFGFFIVAVAHAEELKLQELVDEALKNNHEIHLTEYKVAASTYRIPQVQTLPDPMIMFGYQNEGFQQYTLGKEQGAQWMFSASQMFPFPGKLALKGEMAEREAEGLKASLKGSQLKTVERVKELFYDLFFMYKSMDLVKDRSVLFSRIEDAAMARYSSGMGVQQEVLMAQTEKYMLLEREEMLKQKIQSAEAMLNVTLGRDINATLGRPEERTATVLAEKVQELIAVHVDNSPFVKEKEKMVAAAEAKVRMAEREYYPDFTVNAGYFRRGGEFMDMWSLTTTINIPIFYRTKQRQAVLEAKANLGGAEHELIATKSMLASAIRDNYSMAGTAARLMELYRDGLVPKAYQDFESALAGYRTGKVEALTVISRLKVILDYETLYWGQFAEREKAIAKLETITGGGEKEK